MATIMNKVLAQSYNKKFRFEEEESKTALLIQQLSCC